MPSVDRTDFLVVGSGVAGLATALKASRYGRVVLITKGRLMDSNTRYAQGGIAAAVGPGDTPKDHLSDTLRAGHDLCLTEAAAVLVEDGPLRVKELIELGARFDATPEGTLSLGREAAHSKNRILHARGDATGAEVADVLAEQVVATPEVTLHEHLFAVDLIVENERCVGVSAINSSGETHIFAASAVVLATGGCGRVYRYTTNPSVATGDGLAMASRRGVALIDMEFMQFHPTALARDDDPMVLISEAVRGEGAHLVNDSGRTFMTDVHPQGDLAPRDVVARAIFGEMASGRTVYLDARPIGARFPDRFPTINQACLERGLDPRVDLIPIAPAAHFIMGGVRTDIRGQTSLPGLYACGEVACTGVHGANRLASNSLLEGLVFAERIARGLAQELAYPAPRHLAAEVRASASASTQREITGGNEAVSDTNQDVSELVERLRSVMWDHAGIVRHAAGLKKAETALGEIAAAVPLGAWTLRNMVETGRLITTAALAREESRGGHFREDFPSQSPDWRGRHVIL